MSYDDYPADQVKRRQAYELAHPGVKITADRDKAGRVIFRSIENGLPRRWAYELRDLLDYLESLGEGR